MTPTRQKQLVLVVVVLILIWIGSRGLRQMSARSGSGPIGSGAGTAAERSPDVTRVEVVDLRLEALAVVGGSYSPGRDPFRFAVRPRPAPPPPQPSTEETAGRRATPETLELSVPSDTTEPQPPPIDVIYLGSFGPRYRPLAVFSDGNDIYNALEGDVVKEKFIVEQVGYESVDLGFVGFPDAPLQRLAVGG